MKARDALVVIAALDVRRSPRHQSELRSQLLMGESVRILGATPDRLWARVENRSDGYRGWVRTWGLREVSAAEAQAWRRASRWRLSAPHAIAFRDSAGRHPLTPLFWNCRVAKIETAGRLVGIALPDGDRAWVASKAIRPASRSAGPLGEVIAQFAGVPYLWGGRTPLGFDCSGFVQQVLAARGICLPRDAHEQFLACRRVSHGKERPGDLVFFGPRRGRVTHVGIVVAPGRFSHARGTVSTNSLDPLNALYDSDLTSMFRGFGRPPARAGEGAHSC